MQEENISENNFEQCIKCALCNTLCPLLEVGAPYPGPKQAGPDGSRYRLISPDYYDQALQLCLNCKRCEVACPSDVQVADIIQMARLRYSGKKPGLRNRMLASTDLMGTVASAFAPVVNTALSISPVKSMMDVLFGVSRHRQMPKYASQTFESWFRKNAPDQNVFDKHISYYHGCYANYNFPQLGKDFVSVMNALGYGVHLLDGEKCCGVAKIANNMGSDARKDAVHNIELFRESILGKGWPVITVSTSCTLTVLEEYPNILGVENTDIRGGLSIFERFVYEAVSSGETELVFKPDYKAKVMYHIPCHQARLGWSVFTEKLLAMVPGIILVTPPPHCCGIAGTYGFKKENYAISQNIGNSLFDIIQKNGPDFVACECETCKWQIEMSTGVPVKNPVSIFAEALDLDATAEKNRKK